jgi:tRNA dimethylallyltransferase
MAEKILVVTGPTATGKTALSVELAKKLGGEIVSADSMQIYRGMDIGTAKVTKAEMQNIPHHMIDIADPSEDYSVSRYVEEADAAVRGILSRGRLPIVAGGTNLYIDSLIAGLDFAEKAEDAALRESLNKQYDDIGGEAMLEHLRGFDPERAAKLHPADKRRIVRAVEIYILTGETITRHDEETKKRPKRYDAVKIALTFADRAVLYDRINARVDKMVSDGLFDEVKGLLDSGLSPACTSMQAIGYKEPAAYFRGEMSKDAAIELIKLSSRRYAKRQLTWLRRDTTVLWHERQSF